ncbi:TPA: carbohydrate ABC transporter permease [Enterococcus faecium]|uniref:Carbohydrate ABC transporter permease n=3 Tax=Enterococcus faecium TaxID=1352 RepID=A0A1L2HCH1_ENTFC|nr:MULTISPECIES: carbohydrate ABC transporter permease [Enterococcus]ANB93063.1 sugar ABC transporter ATP-binding protein [Enterococcus faecium]AOM16520.1 sugar ABC transporter ATP-binding protein [Enterococcus faecium]AOM22784.1 sugar ABC transporter ATP-binding protein [Enterococcus faecium]AOM29235.1 sugar ABC transporter ATP-binding protein [Enterococcus faecium]AOM31504.1 sugar ABC transporter ATP-binding protein [Enterococcus faecium]
MMDYFKKTSVNRQTKKILSYVLMTVIGIILIILLLWMVFTSLKPMEEIVRYPPTFFPEKIVWENYLDTIAAFPFWRYARNTLFITVLVVIGNVLSNSFIAYGFAKLDFPGKKLMFALVLSTMMIPGFVTMIPQYVLFSKIGWVGTYLPLIVPSFFGNAFNIFLMRQFYLSINNELIEAAEIDGANHLYIWSHLMLPLTKPALITIAINSFNAAWNDFLGPLLYIQDQEKYTLQIGLQVFQNQATTQWNYLMAGATLVLIPTILLFFFAQRYFIEGMDLTGGSKG